MSVYHVALVHITLSYTNRILEIMSQNVQSKNQHPNRNKKGFQQEAIVNPAGFYYEDEEIRALQYLEIQRQHELISQHSGTPLCPTRRSSSLVITQVQQQPDQVHSNTTQLRASASTENTDTKAHQAEQKTQKRQLGSRTSVKRRDKYKSVRVKSGSSKNKYYLPRGPKERLNRQQKRKVFMIRSLSRDGEKTYSHRMKLKERTLPMML